MSAVCALATFCNPRPFVDTGGALQSLAAQLARPPAQLKLWSSAQAALGIAFTPALPEDVYDVQPIQAATQPFHLVADVRLDNRIELAHKLALAHPETLADSSILAAALERWGPDCLPQLLGAFAFCVWNPQQQELFAARDHVGEYPLFFYRAAGWIAVASRAHALRGLPNVPQGFDDQRIADWLVHLQPNPCSSFFEAIENLRPGHLLRASADGVKIQAYWHLSASKPVRYKRDEEYAEALGELLDRATEPRLRSVRTIATHLSAGLDSGSVTSSAARLLIRKGLRLTAYTSVPQSDFENDPSSWWIMDEGPASAEVAAFYPNIDHVRISIGSVPLVPTWLELGTHFDEPLLNGINWLWFLASLNHAGDRGAGVLLTGVEGNLNISYETMRPLRQMIRRGQWLQFASNGLKQRAFGVTSFHALAASTVAALLPWDRTVVHAPLHDFSDYPITPQFAKRYRLREAAVVAQTALPSDAADLQAGLDRADSGSANAASFAMTGVQLRDPTADKRIWEFCFSIPPEQFIAEGMPRSLIRRAMRGRLPESTLRRTRRGLQGADWHMVVRQALPDLREQLDLLDESPAVHRYLDLPKLRKMLDDLPEDDVNSDRAFHVSHLTMLRAITLGMFLHQHDPEVRGSRLP